MKNDEDLGLEETHRWETGGVLRRLDFILREWRLPRKLNWWSDSLCLSCFPGSDREGEEGGREDAGAGICSPAGGGGESQKRQEDIRSAGEKGGPKYRAGGLWWAVGRVVPWRGALLGKCGLHRPPSSLLLAVSALRNKCPLGLCFLCNILAFDTRCRAVSMRSPGRILQTRLDVYSGFPVSGFGPPRHKLCGFVFSGGELARATSHVRHSVTHVHKEGSLAAEAAGTPGTWPLRSHRTTVLLLKLKASVCVDSGDPEGLCSSEASHGT